jgi:hypothetical protein
MGTNRMPWTIGVEMYKRYEIMYREMRELRMIRMAKEDERRRKNTWWSRPLSLSSLPRVWGTSLLAKMALVKIPRDHDLLTLRFTTHHRTTATF